MKNMKIEQKEVRNEIRQLRQKQSKFTKEITEIQIIETICEQLKYEK